jgi:tetratricopeptide (TPR) repeat protein
VKHPQKNIKKVAWFKLAEFIDRKEKERAISICRLLMHTIPDEAFAKKLEGDMLEALNEPSALQAHELAARLYEKKGNFSQATSLYEHLVDAYPTQERYIQKLAFAYTQLNHPTRTTLSLKRLIPTLLRAHQLQSLEQELPTIATLLPHEQRADVYSFLAHTLKSENFPADIVEKYRKKSAEAHNHAEKHSPQMTNTLGTQ